MDKKDCFAMKDNNCRVMNVTHCEDCTFYRTRKDLEYSIEKVYERLRSLDSATQTYIAEKYYNGRICW